MHKCMRFGRVRVCNSDAIPYYYLHAFTQCGLWINKQQRKIPEDTNQTLQPKLSGAQEKGEHNNIFIKYDRRYT